jgi:enoyl-CoA hydratase/carnithine racemase
MGLRLKEKTPVVISLSGLFSSMPPRKLFPKEIRLSKNSNNPAKAVVAGFLDEIVPTGELAARSLEVARALTAIDLKAHAATKLRVRAACLAALHEAIESELRL